MAETNELMAQKYADRRASGLVRCAVYIPEENKELLGKFVQQVLDGEYSPRPTRVQKEDISTGDLFQS